MNPNFKIQKLGKFLLKQKDILQGLIYLEKLENINTRFQTIQKQSN